MAGMQRLVEELERSYLEAQARMSDPAVYNDHKQAADAGRRLKELEAPYRLAQQWRRAQEDLGIDEEKKQDQEYVRESQQDARERVKPALH